MRAVVLCFWLAQGFVELKCLTTNFAFQLSSLFPIVEIDVLMWSVAMGAGDFLWQRQLG